MSTVKALPIPAANVNGDELDTDTESDDKIISEAEEEILEESSGESENESEIVEIRVECNSVKEIELNWQINCDWTIQVVSQFEEKKLQMNREFTDPLDSGSNPMSFFSLFFFNDELLEDITFQTNFYNTASANDKGTKPAPPVEVDELKKVFGIVLFMGIEKFPNRQL